MTETTQADTTPGNEPDAAAALAEVHESLGKLRAEIRKVIVGQEEVIDQVLMCVLCRGHALLVGVPGLAKTLLISTIARAMDLEFSRVQFTPDLMPADITGTEVIQEDKATGQRELRFVRGPVFANVILADEINRTPPKTQAALLEAMQERQVTIGGVGHELPRPFFVLATQNPLEQEGTYPLPEAQLDRFMLQIRIGYPTAEQELEVVKRSAHKDEVEIASVLNANQIARFQKVVAALPIPDHVLAYALRLVRATRGGDGVPEEVARYVSWGAGPRASEALARAAQARALLDGEAHAGIEQVRAVAAPVLRHRVLLNFNAEADQVSPDSLVEMLIRDIPVEGAGPEHAAVLDRMIKN